MYISSLATAPAAFMRAFTITEGVNLSELHQKKSSEVKEILKKKEISVVRTIDLDEMDMKTSLDVIDPRKMLSTPMALELGSKVELFVKDDQVVFARPFEVTKVDEKTIRNLEKRLDTFRTELDVARSTMRRDLFSTIELKGNIEEAYQPLTKELVKGVTERMDPEVLKDIGRVRGAELKKAGIKSARGVMESVSTEIAMATKESITNAIKYVDHAEDLCMEVAGKIYVELKKANVTDKKDLNKVDTKALAKEFDLPEKTIKEVISEVCK